MGDDKTSGKDPEGFDDPEANKVWEIVADLRRVLRPVSAVHSVQALSVVIADMLSELDEPEHALGILVADAVTMWKTNGDDAEADD